MVLFTDKRIKARCAAAVCAGMMLFGVSACGASSDAGSNVDLQTQESRVYIGGAEDSSDEHNTAGTGTTDVLREASVQESTAQTAQNKTEPDVINGRRVYEDGQKIYLDRTWQYSGNSAINSGYAVMYKAAANRKDIIVGVNAGHGTNGGSSVKAWGHPDCSPKTTGGTTAAGAIEAVAVSGGMTFADGTAESTVTLNMAQILKQKLLAEGYDVLMLRDGEDVQLDNVARTVICNNVADCHISLHWDGDGLDYDKGCFYIAVPDAIKTMDPVARIWEEHDVLGSSLISALRAKGAKINGGGSMQIDLTQTSYSTIPSVDIELGNASSRHDDAALAVLGDGLVQGINNYFGW